MRPADDADGYPGPASRVRIWDLPTRVFHILLAASVLAAIVTAYLGGEWMTWHFRLGEFTLSLLLFRVIWGFAGGHWSRFRTFVSGPGALLRYVRGRPNHGERFDVGHSPTGAASVMAMLGVLLVQVATGMVADDDVSNVGPLNHWVSSALGRAATGYHTTLGQGLVIGLLSLHVIAIAFYRIWHRRNLVKPMWHGDMLVGPENAPAIASQDGRRQRLKALGLFALSVAIVAALLKWAGAG